MSKAVIEIIKETGFHPLLLLHSYLYGRFTPQYIWLRDKLARRSPAKIKGYLADAYHGKVLNLEDAINIIANDKEIRAENLEQIIPHKHAKDLILKNPGSIVVYQCACRSLQRNPCKPTDVCLIIGEPFAGAAIAMQPKKTRRISAEEAISIIKEEDERGHVHTAYFKDTMLNRFYAICNCCKCCCFQMKALNEYGMRTIVPSGYVAQISASCDGCRQCLSFCQFEAIEIEGQKATIKYDRCFGCGVCESKCPINAIALKRDPQKGEPLDVRSLLEDQEKHRWAQS